MPPPGHSIPRLTSGRGRLSKPFVTWRVGHRRNPAPSTVLLAWGCARRIGRRGNPAPRRACGFWSATARSGARAHAELRRGPDDPEQLLAPLGDAHLRRLSLPEESGQSLVAAGLCVHRVMVAVVGAVQG